MLLAKDALVKVLYPIVRVPVLIVFARKTETSTRHVLVSILVQPVLRVINVKVAALLPLPITLVLSFSTQSALRVHLLVLASVLVIVHAQLQCMPFSHACTLPLILLGSLQDNRHALVFSVVINYCFFL